MSRRRSVAQWALAAVLPGVALAAAAVLRFLDGDEGDYAAAAGLVVDGKVLYHDFLYTQTPLFPYVYGGWGVVTGETWLGLRALSVALGVALAVLVYAHVRERLGGRWGLVALALLTASGLYLTWFPTVKTYALSTLLLFGAYAVMARERRLSARAAAAAGVLAALSVQTRSLLVGGAVVLLWAAWRARNARAYIAGFIVGSAPSLLFLAIDADRYLFGNLWYHGARSEGGLVGNFEQKVEVVANLLGVATDARPLPQYLLLIAATVVAIVTFRTAGRVLPLALWVAAGLALVALLPTPTYTQYFATTVPFLVVVVVELAAYVRANADTSFSRAVGVAVFGAYLVIAPADFRQIVKSSREDRPLAVQKVNDRVDAETEDGDTVVAAWSGYVYGTGARQLPGLENAFAPHEAAALSPAEARKYHVASVADVEGAIRARTPRLVVVKVWHDLPPIPEFDAAARSGGYELAADVETVRIYAPR